MMIFLSLLLIPILIALIVRLVFKSTITWGEMGIQMGAMCAILSVIWGIAYFSSVSEYQIINGKIVSKEREHGSYVEAYTCNCVTICNGKTCNTTCQTCFRTHYTVDWYLNTTIGNIRLEYYDRLSSYVYNSPNPQIYKDAVIDSHCSKYVRQDNYIKAAPRSLFNLDDGINFNRFTNMIPKYPEIYQKYKSVHVFNSGTNLDVNSWNSYFLDKIKTIGTNVNPIIVLTDQDQMYKEALEHSWLGGSARDAVIIIGTNDNKIINWVDGFTVGKSEGNHLMLSKLRSELTGKFLNNHEAILDTLDFIIRMNYKRKNMEDFKYLKKDIRPSNWVTIIVFILAFVGSCVLSYVFHSNDVTNI